MSTPPCAGKWELFDSIDVNDHRIARALCAECPMVAACQERLRVARADALGGQKYGPSGTWAGQLLGGPKTSVLRAQAEEAMFTEDELRTLHADYAAGFRSPRTVVAERVYQRQKKRAQSARKRAA